MLYDLVEQTSFIIPKMDEENFDGMHTIAAVAIFYLSLFTIVWWIHIHVGSDLSAEDIFKGLN